MKVKKKVRRVLRVRYWKRWYYIGAYTLWSMIQPVDRHLVLFLSDSRLGFSGNFDYLRAEIERSFPDTKIVGIFKGKLKEPRKRRDVLRLPLLAARAYTIVVDDYYPLIYPLKIRRGSILLQVWHAAGAFKRVGYSRERLPGSPKPGSIAHRNYTYATVSSDSIRDDYAEAFSMRPGRVLPLGVPRTDEFFERRRVEQAAKAVRDRYGIRDGQKVALFAPTFRGPGQKTAHYPSDWIDWNALAEALGKDWRILVKMHPFVAPLSETNPEATGVTDVSQDREITELMMAADVLVTDYSSAIFEFALLRRPMVFFCPDLEEYRASRDFYYPLDDYLIGPMIREQGALTEAIAKAETEPGLDGFLDRFMGACDGHSTERIVSRLVVNHDPNGRGMAEDSVNTQPNDKLAQGPVSE